MIKILSCFFLTMITVSVAHAQINVGSIQLTRLEAGKFETEDMKDLREAETLFIMRSENEDNIKEWQTMLDEVWTINKITAIKRSEISNYIEVSNKNSYAFLGLEGHATTVQTKSISYVVSHYYLHLSMLGDEMPYSGKELRRLEHKGEVPTPRYEVRSFAKIAIYPDGSVMGLAEEFRYSFSLNDQQKTDHMEYLYDEAYFYNWELGFMKNSLQEVNRVLNNDETRWMFSEIVNDAQIKKLRQETLFVPDYVLVKFNKFNGNEDNKHDREQLFKNYKYRYELIDGDELSAKILEEKEPFYYFNYVRSSTDAFYTITNSNTGEIIYSDYDPVTYNIKPKNIKAISRTIEKAN